MTPEQATTIISQLRWIEIGVWAIFWCLVYYVYWRRS